MKAKQEGFSVNLVILVVSLVLITGVAFIYVNNQEEPTVTDTPTGQDTDTPGQDQQETIFTIIDGKITEVRQDCAPALILGDDGKTVVTSEEPVLCDAGSFVIVNGITIQTASGFVVPEESFSFDISGLQPGMMVEARYMKTSDTTGTLDCDGCLIVQEVN